MKELKPCPFCGSNKILVSERRCMNIDYAIVTCCRCNVSQMGANHKTKEDAIKAWNRRVQHETVLQIL